MVVREHLDADPPQARGRRYSFIMLHLALTTSRLYLSTYCVHVCCGSEKKAVFCIVSRKDFISDRMPVQKKSISASPDESQVQIAP